MNDYTKWFYVESGLLNKNRMRIRLHTNEVLIPKQLYSLQEHGFGYDANAKCIYCPFFTIKKDKSGKLR